MARNSCREPWLNTTIAAVRQVLVSSGGRAVSAQLDVFNVLNLLRRDWGQVRVADGALLEQVGQTAEPSGATQPVFRFDRVKPQWTTLSTESEFQIQLSVHYDY